MGSYGKVNEFNIDEEEWNSYYERFENWIIVNDIPLEKKTRLLLAVIGSKTYGILKTISAGVDVSKLSAEEINKILREHYDPKPIIVSERYKFWTTKQFIGESIIEFSLRIQKQNRSCEFETFEDQALRDVFLVGMTDMKQNIRPSLLIEKNLTFKQAVDKACQIEAASTESALISGFPTEVNKVKQNSLSYLFLFRTIGSF